MKLLPIIHPELCTGCECCVLCCPTHALELVDGKATLARPELCDYEALCEDVCMAGAIELPYRIVLGTAGELRQGQPPLPMAETFSEESDGV